MNPYSSVAHPAHIYNLGIFLGPEGHFIGDEVRARLGDKYFPAKIIEVNINKSDPLKNRYYVHFGHVSNRSDVSN